MFALVPLYFQKNIAESDIIQRRSIKEKNVDRERLNIFVFQIILSVGSSIVGAIITAIFQHFLNMIYYKDINSEVYKEKRKIILNYFKEKNNVLSTDIELRLKKIRNAMIKLKVIFTFSKIIQNKKINENFLHNNNYLVIVKSNVQNIPKQVGLKKLEEADLDKTDEVNILKNNLNEAEEEKFKNIMEEENYYVINKENKNITDQNENFIDQKEKMEHS